MSGLGIVLEETDRQRDLRNLPVPNADNTHIQQPDLLLPHPDTRLNDETLLPPLPESGDVQSLANARPSLQALATSSSAATATVLMPPGSSPGSDPGYFRLHKNSLSLTDASEKESFLIVPQLYALDSLALGIDTAPIAFPSVEHLSSSAPSLVPAPTQSTNTSPLRRLKSIKNGIRKLSLSRMGSSSSIPSPQTQEPPNVDLEHSGSRTLYSPIQNDRFPHENCLLSSGNDSMKSTFSSLGNVFFSNAYTSQLVNGGGSTTASTPQGPMHGHTSSLGLNNSLTVPKTRRRTILLSNSSSSTAPALPLPVVTVSENLSSNKRNLAAIEQSFFDNWGTNTLNNSNDLLGQVLAYSSQSSRQGDYFSSGRNDGPEDKLAMLNTPDDLMEYLIFLVQHKRSVESAYEVSRNRLISSGWCSGQDIENLSLQRDSSVSQIDSKLLQIEERLNSQFNISFLSTKYAQQSTAGLKCASRDFSPSLKDLENKCLFFSAENGNLCQ